MAISLSSRCGLEVEGEEKIRKRSGCNQVLAIGGHSSVNMCEYWLVRIPFSLYFSFTSSLIGTCPFCLRRPRCMNLLLAGRIPFKAPARNLLSMNRFLRMAAWLDYSGLWLRHPKVCLTTICILLASFEHLLSFRTSRQTITSLEPQRLIALIVQYSTVVYFCLGSCPSPFSGCCKQMITRAFHHTCERPHPTYPTNFSPLPHRKSPWCAIASNRTRWRGTRSMSPPEVVGQACSSYSHRLSLAQP